MREAMLYERNRDGTVDCSLCRHRCHIKDGRRGLCHVRENRGGTLYSVFYGQPVALSVDPIEKKPLFHFYPGTRSLSLATLGCNFQCEFCQKPSSARSRCPGTEKQVVEPWLSTAPSC